MMRSKMLFVVFLFCMVAMARAQDGPVTTQTIITSINGVTTRTTIVTSSEGTTETTAVDSKTSPLGILQDWDAAVEDLQENLRSIDTMQWIQAIAAILFGLILQRLVKNVMNRLAGQKKRGEGVAINHFRTVLFCSLRAPLGWLPVVLAIAAAGLALGLDMGTIVEPTAFRSLIVALLVINVTWMCYNLVDALTHLLGNFARRTDTPLDNDLVPLIHKTMKISVLVMGVVTLGSYVGGPFKGILAGVGLGGLAVALAARDTLANFFGYIVLFLDRPFVVGNRIKVFDIYGDVEDVGLRSTKIRTRDRTLVSIPNSVVASEYIENFSKRPARMVDYAVGVTYSTNAEQMEKLVEAIRHILETTEGVEQGTFCLGFNEFGGSSLDIRMRYYTLETLLPGYLATRQRVNLAIMRTVEEHGLSIAFPTRTLYLRQDPDGQPLFPPSGEAPPERNN